MTVMPLMVSKALHVNISNMQSSENGQSNGDAMYSIGYSGQTAIELNWKTQMEKIGYQHGMREEC